MLGMMLLPERRCSKCTEAKQQQWGCETDVAVPMMLDDEELRRCPLRPYYEDPESYIELMDAVWWLEKGHLPDPGCWPDQSAKLLGLSSVVLAAREDANEVLRKRKP